MRTDIGDATTTSRPPAARRTSASRSAAANSIARMETGWAKRVANILDEAPAAGLDDKAEAYIRDTFPNSRDRLNTLATTVATVGTFLLGLLAVAVTISAGLSTESSKVVEARQAKEVLAANCARKETESAARYLQVKEDQAQEKLERAQNRSDDVKRISTTQLYAGLLTLFAFLAALGSQLVNPIVPPPYLEDRRKLSDWKKVHRRYRQKRHLAEAALVFDLAAAAALGFFGLGVL